MKKLNNALEAALVVAIISLLGVSTELGADIRRQSLAALDAGEPATWPDSALTEWVLALFGVTLVLALAYFALTSFMRKRGHKA